jgi:hypothetical protein
MTRILFSAVASMVLLVSAPAFAGRADLRQVREEERIREGVRSGELSRAEAARLELRHRQIGREIRRDRALNAGHLTPSEKARIERQQDRLNRHIWQEKHD